MNKIAFEKRVLVILIAVLMVAVFSAVFVNNSLGSIVDEISEKSELNRNVVILKGTIADVLDAESSVRSYGLTNDPVYSNQYKGKINQVQLKLTQLASGVVKGTVLDDRLPELDSLIQQKFKILDELVFIQNQRSAERVLDNVEEKVGDVNTAVISAERKESRNRIEEATKQEEKKGQEEEKKFFKKLFDRNSDEGETSSETVTRRQPKTDEAGVKLKSSFNIIDDELERLREKETEFERSLKLRELELIQADKEIMDEIQDLVNDLEKAEANNMQEKIAFAEKKRSSTHVHILLFCLLTCVLLALAGYAVYVYVRRNNQYKKALRSAKAETDYKNREITDSISYARRIQSAIMPSDKRIKEVFPNSFVYYRPKDIVAGDFYWLAEIANYTFIAVADCTGHGVPGAMVSVACSGALNRSVKEFQLRDPAHILDKSREIIIETFDEGETELYDGMDISLCRLDKETGELIYAGANNSLYFVKNGELKEVKAKKQPVARYYTNEKFESHQVDVGKGDTLYLFTDGFADQFGGPRRKKFMYRRFKNLLLALSEETVSDQKNAIANAFNDWKGDVDQMDDVCVIGVKL